MSGVGAAQWLQSLQAAGASPSLSSHAVSICDKRTKLHFPVRAHLLEVWKLIDEAAAIWREPRSHDHGRLSLGVRGGAPSL